MLKKKDDFGCFDESVFRGLQCRDDQLTTLEELNTNWGTVEACDVVVMVCLRGALDGKKIILKGKDKLEKRDPSHPLNMLTITTDTENYGKIFLKFATRRRPSSN